MKLIGVTGSFGKTSVCEIVYQYLLYSGYKTSLYSSNGLFANGLTRTKDFLQTSLYIKDLEKFLGEDKDDEVEFAIVEITGESVMRNDNIHLLPYEVIALTSFYNNLYNHYSSKEEYFNCKRTILEKGNAKCILLRNEDPNYTWFSDIRHKTYGYTDKSTYQIEVLDNTIQGLKLKCDGFTFQSNLITAYHARNISGAIAILKEIQVFDIKQFAEFSKNIFIRGRFEKVNCNGKNIILDTGYSGAQIVLNGLERTLNSNNFKVVFSNIRYDEDGEWVKNARKNNGTYLQKAKYIYLTNMDEEIDDLKIFNEEMFINNYTNFIYIKDNSEAISKAISELVEDETLIIFTRDLYRKCRHIIQDFKLI